MNTLVSAANDGEHLPEHTNNPVFTEKYVPLMMHAEEGGQLLVSAASRQKGKRLPLYPGKCSDISGGL